MLKGDSLIQEIVWPKPIVLDQGRYQPIPFQAAFPDRPDKLPECMEQVVAIPVVPPGQIRDGPWKTRRQLNTDHEAGDLKAA
jgi:hypothetical protein